jgi:hypothetical protein
MASSNFEAEYEEDESGEDEDEDGEDEVSIIDVCPYCPDLSPYYYHGRGPMIPGVTSCFTKLVRRLVQLTLPKRSSATLVDICASVIPLIVPISNHSVTPPPKGGYLYEDHSPGVFERHNMSMVLLHQRLVTRCRSIHRSYGSRCSSARHLLRRKRGTIC